MKKRFEFQVTTSYGNKKRVRITKRYSNTQEEAEDHIRKMSKSNIISIIPTDQLPKKEEKHSKEGIEECAICDRPVYKRGWCIHHYDKIF
jgi:hypothetical protein